MSHALNNPGMQINREMLNGSSQYKRRAVDDLEFFQIEEKRVDERILISSLDKQINNAAIVHRP